MECLIVHLNISDFSLCINISRRFYFIPCGEILPPFLRPTSIFPGDISTKSATLSYKCRLQFEKLQFLISSHKLSLLSPQQEISKCIRIMPKMNFARPILNIAFHDVFPPVLDHFHYGKCKRT